VAVVDGVDFGVGVVVMEVVLFVRVSRMLKSSLVGEKKLVGGRLLSAPLLLDWM
jgi:hypothetical protein